MRVGLAISLMAFSACVALGQAAETSPAFDVASVKVSQAPVTGQRVRSDVLTLSPAGVTMMNTRLKSVVQWAYHLQTVQISGPGWLDSNRYDIIAKVSAPAPADRLRRMMQTLLAQRFKLAVHTEMREMPAYVFTVAKGGHKMRPSEGDGEMAVKPNANRMITSFTHVTVAQLGDILSSPLHAVVVDRTGLEGAWDFDLDSSTFTMIQPAGIDDAVNILIQVVNEQLGIKVEQKKAPAELLIVDHAEKVPVEN